MARKLTQEERNILLDNPELVMFNPYSALRTHGFSLGKALVLPIVTGVLFILWGILCPEWVSTHPHLFAGIGVAGLIIASGAVPILYMISDDRTFKKADSEHYAKQLRLLLPEDLECRIAHIQWVIAEKAEGSWIMDGKEEMFGFASYVNHFAIEPDTDLAIVTDGKKFWAFVKRDPKTECLYH
jgi:hypothetical protein